ncbi:MAG: cytochrome c-type biogenesis protein CcmE, partial [Myxococcota bacterium]
VGMSDMGDDLVYYWTPTELISAAHAEEATVRLGGMVKPGTLDWDRDAQRASFIITDGDNEVPVHCSGNPPQMFREGIGAVVEGKLGSDGVFRTDRVMVKHSNEYEAPEAHAANAANASATLVEGE